MRWIRLEKAEPLKVKYKTTFSDDIPFSVVNFEKKQNVGRPVLNLSNIVQEKLYPSGKPITMAKKRDMMDLLQYIPPVHHTYYKNLNAGERGAPEPPSDDECFLYSD